MKIIDLHTHSYYSDGTFSPYDLARHAKNAGLSAIALTDHDTAKGVCEARSAGLEAGLEVIAGVELAAEYLGSEIHILGYFIDYEGQYFNGKMNELAQIRAERNLKLIARLDSLGFHLTDDDIKKATGKNTLTRLHLAKAMFEKGYSNSTAEAFERYLADGRPAYIGRNGFSYNEVIEIINKSGGVSSLAHPYSYKWAGGEVIRMLECLRAAGLNAVEAVYPTHDMRQTKTLIKSAEKLGLVISGGSDFHGAHKPGIQIGTGKGNIEVSYEILEGLRKCNGQNTIV